MAGASAAPAGTARGGGCSIGACCISASSSAAVPPTQQQTRSSRRIAARCMHTRPMGSTRRASNCCLKQVSNSHLQAQPFDVRVGGHPLRLGGAGHLLYPHPATRCLAAPDARRRLAAAAAALLLPFSSCYHNPNTAEARWEVTPRLLLSDCALRQKGGGCGVAAARAGRAERAAVSGGRRRRQQEERQAWKLHGAAPDTMG